MGDKERESEVEGGDRREKGKKEKEMRRRGGR